jgi:response regulator RpfG family c-di-GMP phosphodiesterase
VSPGPATLLLVDDEVRILSALRRVLRREGYRLLTAETPDEQAVDVIVTDQKMPGMSGLQLLAEAARRRPEARRLLITGWTEEVPREQIEALGIRAMIPKPWDDAELKATLRAQISP